jgi:hypothetical protein
MSVHDPVNPHGSLRDVLERFAARHGRAPTKIEAQCLRHHWRMHSPGAGQPVSGVGRPLMDLNSGESKTNPYKMGQPPEVDTAMSEFKYDPFKMGNTEKENVMLGYTHTDPFKMGYTRTDPFKMGYTRTDPFKMGDSYAAGRAEQLAAANAVVGAAKAGDPKAKATIKKTVAAAKQGVPAAKKAVKDMRAADGAQRARAAAKNVMTDKFMAFSSDLLKTPLFSYGLSVAVAKTR